MRSATPRRILDGITEDETVFALLYEPDDPTNWMSDDLILAHGNPLALEVPEIMDDLKQKRKAAIEVEGRRENFLCKHCNIIYQGVGHGDLGPGGGCASLQGRSYRLVRP